MNAPRKPLVGQMPPVWFPNDPDAAITAILLFISKTKKRQTLYGQVWLKIRR